MSKAMMGQGSTECAICKAAIKEYRTLKIKIIGDLPDRKQLASLRYFLPLCEQHGNKDEVIDVVLEWGENTPATQVMG